MKRIELEATAVAEASAKRVFSLLAKSADYPTWSMIGLYECEAPPESDHNGRGEIRVFRSGVLTMREKVTVFQPNRRIDYQLLSGLPVHEYRGSTNLKPAGLGKTRFIWRSSFRPTNLFAGLILKPFMTYVLNRLVGDLANTAEAGG